MRTTQSIYFTVDVPKESVGPIKNSYKMNINSDFDKVIFGISRKGFQLDPEDLEKFLSGKLTLKVNDAPAQEYEMGQIPTGSFRDDRLDLIEEMKIARDDILHISADFPEHDFKINFKFYVYLDGISHDEQPPQELATKIK